MPQNCDWLVHHFDRMTGSRASLRRGGHPKKTQKTRRVCYNLGKKGYHLRPVRAGAHPNIRQETTLYFFPISLFHLLTVLEPDRYRSRRSTRQQDSSPTLSRSHTPAAPAPTIVFVSSPPPVPYSGLPQMHPGMTQHYFPLSSPIPGSRL
jgi:hypothetical protein